MRAQRGSMRSLAVVGLAYVYMFFVSNGVAAALPEIRCGGANGWNTGVVGAASCPFALNVARAIDPNWVSRNFYVKVSSPVTGLDYTIDCHDMTSASGQSRAYECGVAGNGIVYLWQ